LDEIGTPVAPLAGSDHETARGAASVVNVKTNGAIAAPALFVPPLIVAVYVIPYASGADGVHVAVYVPEL